MRFCNLVQYDQKIGWKKIKKQIFITIGFMILISISINNTFSHYKVMGQHTYGDSLLYLFRGAKVYIPTIDNPFHIPVLWVLMYAWFFYITLQFVYGDIHGMGQVIMIQAKSRTAWWLSKCVWTLEAALLYFVIIYVIMLINAVIMGYTISLNISEGMVELLELEAESIQDIPWKIREELLLMPLSGVAAWGLFQLMLTIKLTPIVVYIISMIYWLSSSYIFNSWLLGNYTMIMRNGRVIIDGVSTLQGLALFLGLSMLSIAGGIYLMKNSNVINTKVGE